MFKKRMKIEVVPESQYTDFSERMNEYATKKTVIAACIPLAIVVPIVATSLSKAEPYTSTTIPVAAAIEPTLPIPAVEPVIEPVLNTLAQSPSFIPVTSSPEVIQTGIVADKSLEAIASVMDPLIDILVAISFPVASVIMVGACFFFMFGNSEKAWDMIMKAGLGYVLIGVASGKCGFTTLRKSKHKKPNFSVL